MYKDSCTQIDFKIWQVLSGKLLANILEIDNLDKSHMFTKEAFFENRDAEKDICGGVEKTRKEDKEAAWADEDDIYCQVNSPTKQVTG